MNDWPQVRLSDVLELQRRWIQPEPEQLYTEIGIRSYGKGIFHKSPISGLELGNKRVLRIEPDDLVFNNVFAWEGAVAVAEDSESGTIGSHRFITLRPRNKRCDVRYLKLYFQSEAGLPVVAKASPGSAGRNRTLGINRFLDQSITLPPLSEQRRIVTRIEKLAAKIQEARGLRREVNHGSKAMLHSAFSQIIEGAPRLRIRDVAPLVRRAVEITIEGEYRELGVRSFGNGVFHKPTLHGADLTWQKLFRVHEGDIIISNIKAWEGAIAEAEPGDDGRVGSHRYLTLVPIAGKATAGFLCFYLLTPVGLADIGRASPGSADRNRTLGQKALQEIEVPVPDYDQQVWFDRLQAEVRKVFAAQQDAEAELDALLPSILDKAFKGEL